MHLQSLINAYSADDRDCSVGGSTDGVADWAMRTHIRLYYGLSGAPDNTAVVDAVFERQPPVSPRATAEVSAELVQAISGYPDPRRLLQRAE